MEIELFKLLTVFGLGAIELWAAIPAGFVMGLHPLFTGAPLGAALGIALGVQKGQLFFWMTTGIVLWAALLTIIGVLGLAGLEALLQYK